MRRNAGRASGGALGWRLSVNQEKKKTRYRMQEEKVRRTAHMVRIRKDIILAGNLKESNPAEYLGTEGRIHSKCNLN